MYSVTDKCSFDDCNRLKFLINYNKRRRKLGSNSKVRFLCVFVCLLDFIFYVMLKNRFFLEIISIYG